MYFPNQFATEIQNDRLQAAANRRVQAAARREHAARERDRATAVTRSGLRRRAAWEFARRTIAGVAA